MWGSNSRTARLWPGWSRTLNRLRHPGALNHNFFIHSSVDGHLGSFYNLAIVESTAINIGVQVPLCVSTPVSLAVLFLGHREDLFLIFGGTSTLFSRVGVPVCIPTNSARGLPFLHILSRICSLLFCSFSHSDWREVISECGFDLYFPDEEQRWASFHVPVGHLDVFFREVSIHAKPSI